MATNKTAFISSIMPAAIQYGQQIGVDPRIIVAQAAHESAWGRSAPGNNYFGIKSHGKGGGQTFTTHEVINGQRVKINDSFRRFDSPSDSVAGYADFLKSNKRYQPMLAAQGLDAQIDALGRSGYATDPNYADRIRSIAKSIPLGSQIASQEASPPQASGTPAPALPDPINVGQPPATPMKSDTPPPAGLFAAMSQGAAPAADKMSGLLEMLGQLDQPKQQPMQLQPMQRQANVPSLTDYISQFISGRTA